jgi:CheY-like chemotaxis protein
MIRVSPPFTVAISSRIDVLMPNKDGWQVLADLKRSDLTRDIPVIMCTLVSDGARASELGAVDYLSKPILEADLLRALRRLPARVAADGPRPDVLVIDDEPDDIELIRGVLTAPAAGNLQVLAALGGEAGLSAARQHHPRAIILDLLMPDMDGYKVLAELQTDPATRSIPVIVVTGAELSSDDRHRLTRQVTALRQKGMFKDDEILQDLQRALGLEA